MGTLRTMTEGYPSAKAVCVHLWKDAEEQKMPEVIKTSGIVRAQKLCLLLQNSDTIMIAL